MQSEEFDRMWKCIQYLRSKYDLNVAKKQKQQRWLRREVKATLKLKQCKAEMAQITENELK